MKAAAVLLVTLGVLASVDARCSNGCSGHGTCGANDKCTCYANFQGSDCSERTCAYGLAWVDIAIASVDAHNYAECSNRGTCDRKTGICKCFPGYDGSSCQRASCNNRCSGHGTCQYIEELAKDSDVGGNSGYLYIGQWDRTKTQGCKCDAGWEGADCSLRMCPRGDDPLTTGDVNEVQKVMFTGQDQDMEGEFTLTFTDAYNGQWTTRPIELCNGILCGYLDFDATNDNLANELTLEAESSSSTTDYYKGLWIRVWGSCGDVDEALISGYDGTNRIVTVSSNHAWSGLLNCGRGTRYEIFGHGNLTASGSSDTKVVQLGSHENEASRAESYYADAVIYIHGGTGNCGHDSRVISSFVRSSQQVTAATAFSNQCDEGQFYTITRRISATDVETALENLPDTVIQDVTVTFSGEAQTSATSKAGFLVTFVNPSNTNGNLLSVGSSGCNQAGCSPRYSGVFTRAVTDQTFNSLSTSVYGGANYTVSGTYTGQLYRDEASVISKDAAPGKAIVDIAITTDNPSDGGTADQFTVTWNKATSGSATAISNSPISLGRGLTINFLDPTDWYTGTDKISFNIGKGQVSAAVTDATSGTKKEWNTCSGRGVCDSENGICGCFSGYTGEACSIQTVLV